MNSKSFAKFHSLEARDKVIYLIVFTTFATEARNGHQALESCEYVPVQVQKKI